MLKNSVANEGLEMCSQHLLDKGVDQLLSVSEGSISLEETVSLLLEPTVGGGELEGPEEVVGLLELRSDGNNLVNEVLDGVDSELSELTLNDGIVSERDSGSVDLSVSSLVNELLDGGSGWVSVGDEWFDDLDHVHGGLVQLNEDTVVELSKSEELQDLLGLRSELIDTKKHSHKHDIITITNSCQLILLLNPTGILPSPRPLDPSVAPPNY